MADRFSYDEIELDINPCRGCEDYDAPYGCKSNGGCGKPITNADRIRAMSVEEIAEFINGVEAEAIRRAGLFIAVGDIQRGKEGWLDWLKQEASDAL